MDDFFSDGSYEEGQEQTRRYQELLRMFLREDLSAMVEEGRLDDAIEKRVRVLAEAGHFGPELREAAARRAAADRRRREKSGLRALVAGRRGPALAGIVLVLAATGGWWFFQRSSTASSPDAGAAPPDAQERAAGAAGTTDPGSPPEPSLQEMLARVDTMLRQDPSQFEELTSRLPAEQLGASLNEFRQGTATAEQRTRIRRAMTQLILRDQGVELGTVDGLYGAGCTGAACPAIEREWQRRSQDTTDYVPAYPSGISRDSLMVRMEAFEKAVIAEYLGLWEPGP